MRLTLLPIIASMLFTSLSIASPKSFDDAKKILKEVYGRSGEEVYCGCTYNRGKVNPESCGFQSDKYKKRQNILEWEHVVPAENFGRSFSEWREGAPECRNRKSTFKGRKCASKASGQFRIMEADLHNLLPSMGAVNALRSNYDPKVIQFGAMNFGSCKTKVTKGAVEPRDEIKGLFARKYLYMAAQYPKHFRMGGPTEKLMNAWDKMYPVSKKECEMDKLISRHQGWRNPFVERKCKN